MVRFTLVILTLLLCGCLLDTVGLVVVSKTSNKECVTRVETTIRAIDLTTATQSQPATYSYGPKEKLW